MLWPADRSRSQAFENSLEQLGRAESQGYHGAWLADRGGSQREVDPAIHLAAASLASRTRTIRIGAAITVLPFMHPLRVAEEVAMLDVVSEGRIDWAVAAAREIAGSSQEVERRHDVFCEQLEVIRQAWAGQAFRHAGAVYNFDELQCFPNPIQQPTPTVYIAARHASAIRWAAENGHPMLADHVSPLARLETDRRLYLETAAMSGRDASSTEIPTVRQVYVGASMRRAREEAGPGLLRSYDSPAQAAWLATASRDRAPEADPERLLEFLFDECAIIGDEAYCRDRITELRESIDLSHLIAWQSFGDLSHEQTLASQERLIEKVAPAFA